MKLIIFSIFLILILILLIPLYIALGYTKGKNPFDLDNYKDPKIPYQILFYSLLVSYIFIIALVVTFIHEIKMLARLILVGHKSNR